MKQLLTIYKTHKEDMYVLFVILILSIPSVISLLHAGFFQTDDGNWMVIRFAAFFDSFRDLQIPTRLLSQSNHGYGYPVSNFLYPLFLYLGVPLKLLGLSFVGVIKILFALSMIASVVGMYILLRTYGSRFTALIGSLFYLYAPYHLFDLTVRGSLGELLALAIAPFLMFSLRRNHFFFSSVLTAMLLLSHNSLALLLLPLLYFIALLETKKKRDIVYPLLLGGLMSAFFWIPALLELPLTAFSQTAISNPQEYFADLLQIGIPLLLLLPAGIYFYFKQNNKSLTIGIMLLILFLTLFFSSSLSSAVWTYLPDQFVQFPFRLLSLSIFSGAFICQFVFQKVRYAQFLSILFIIVVIITNPYLLPKGYDNYEDGYYSTNQATTTVQDEYMPYWVKEKPSSYSSQIWEIKSGSVEQRIVRSNRIELKATLPEEQTISIKRIYYPGWSATVNGQDAEIRYSNNRGIMEITLPKGDSMLVLRFAETPLRLSSDAISIGAFAIVLFMGLRKRKI